MTTTLTVISSMATRQILSELAGLQERSSGQGVSVQSVGGVEAARRVRAGECFDIVVLASSVMAQLELEEHVVATSRVDFARSGMAIAIRAGCPKPPIQSEEAVRRAIGEAVSVGYSTGPSGDHLKHLIERWGMAETVGPKLVQAPAGVPVASLLAGGAAELGVQQLSELLGAPGIEILGPLPPAIQATTIFTAGIARTCRDLTLAQDFIDVLVSEEAGSVKRRYGMEPAGRTDL